jgi:hypothetical protein
MEAALLWGLTPFDFRSRPAMERAIMLAHHRERSMRSAMVARVQHDLAKKKPSAPDHTADFFGGV